MSRNKLIMIASMMLTIVIVTGWLGENRPVPGSPVEFEPPPSTPNPDRANQSSAASECPSLAEFKERYPDATPDDIVEIERCNREVERTTGPEQADMEF